jgi:hypothetical protein
MKPDCMSEAIVQHSMKVSPIDIDTGCVFGGKLTALQYTKMETQSVSAKQIYYAFS